MNTELAFLIFRYHPYGGLQRDLIKIATVCQQRGYRVRVYTLSWEGPIPKTIEVQIIPTTHLTNHGAAQTLTQYAENCIPPSIPRIGFNRMPGLDLYFAGDACLKKSLLHRIGGKWLAYLPRYRTYLAYEQAIFDPSASTHILLLTQQQQIDAMHYYHTPPERMHLLPPGVISPSLHDHQNQRKQMRHVLHVQMQDTLLLMVGSDYIRKGVDRAIRALAKLPKSMRDRTHLVIVGRGQTTLLHYLARWLNVSENIHFVGTCETAIPYFQAADFLIHPARQETAGMVLIEALMLGLPVLTTANCGYAHHIKAANAGIVISEPMTQTALNKGLLQICSATDAQRQEWHASAIAYTTEQDLSGLPERAADKIESLSKLLHMRHKK